MPTPLLQLAGSFHDVSRALACVLVLAGLWLAACSPGSPPPAPPAGQGEVLVRVQGLRSTSGRVLVSLFRSGEGFPEKPPLAAANLSKEALGPLDFRFPSLPYRRYALSVLHDENRDGKMNRNWLGIPREGFGFSGNPGNRFGKPSFDEAAFLLDSPRQQIPVVLRYVGPGSGHRSE